jgi:hypothetical protein
MPRKRFMGLRYYREFLSKFTGTGVPSCKQAWLVQAGGRFVLGMRGGLHQVAGIYDVRLFLASYVIDSREKRHALLKASAAKQFAEKPPECVIPRSAATRNLSFSWHSAKRDSSLPSE